MDMIQIYFNRLDITADLIRSVKQDQWGDATPCAEFTVRDLVNHLLGDTRGLAAGARGEMVDQATLVGAQTDHIANAGDDHVAAIDEVVAEVRAAWSEPGVVDKAFNFNGNEVPGNRALRIALLEAVVHGWDIAKATKQSYEIPDMLAAPMLEGLKKGLGAQREPGGPFAPVVELPDDASIADQLIAFTGRTP